MGKNGLGLSILIEAENFSGYVAIDSLVNNTSSGGVRVLEDVSFEEIKALASEMTLKFSFIGLPRGGAKSGVRIPSGISHDEKIRLLEGFGKRLAPIIKACTYFPGMDMNCGPEELRAIYRGAGLTLGEITDTSYFTAISVANAVYACEELARGERPLRVAIEGFGSVGCYLAERLPVDRFQIVALSTMKGAVIKDDGFDTAALVRCRKEFGDDVAVRIDEGRQIEKAEVLTANVDILIPSARTWVINNSNMADVKARFIVPVANAPYTEDAIAHLHQRGIVCLPGFVTNSGGVYASSLFDSGVSVEKIEKISGRYYKDAVSALLEKSALLNVSPVVLAEKIARRRLEASLTDGAKELSPGLLKKLYRKGVVPKSVFGGVVLGRFVDNLKALKGQIIES